MSHEDEVGDEVEEGEEAMQPQDLTPIKSKTWEGETPSPTPMVSPGTPSPTDHPLVCAFRLLEGMAVVRRGCPTN